MSIQQNLNQAVAIGGALYSQSATAELRKTAALEKREVAKIDKAMAALDANREETADKTRSMAENNPKIAGEIMLAGRERTAEITDKRDELAERKAELTGDYSEVATIDVYQRAMEIANESAQAKREAKRKQMENLVNQLDEEQKDFVDMIKDPAMKKQAMKQLTGGNR